jgi:hypothetical protein
VRRAALLVALVAAAPALAEPGFDQTLDNLGFELRAFTGYAPGFGAGFLYGVDARAVVQSNRFGLVVGGRAGAAGLDAYRGPMGAKAKSEQIAQIELGGRMFLNPTSRTGVFISAGGDGGTMYVDFFNFRHADAWGLFAEVGLEYPRTQATRLTAALRVSGGIAPHAEFSRIPSDGYYFFITLNVGVFFGGVDTGTAQERLPVDLHTLGF